MKARKTNVSQTQKNPVKTVLIVLGVAAFFGLAVAGWMSGAPKTVGSYGGVEIPAGVYRLCQYQALSGADDTKDTEAIEAAVLENLQYYAAVESRFAALGEELTREEKKEAERYAAEMWQYYGGLYGSYGIDQKTLEAYQYNYYKTLHLLAADNAGLTEAELNDYAQNKMVYGHYVTVPLYSSETYETADEDTVDAMLAAGEAAVKAYGEKRMLSAQAGAEAELADFTAVLKEQLPAVYAPMGEEYDPSALENELGLRLLYIGFESGDDEVLKFMKKGHTVDMALTVAKKLNDAHIPFNTIIMYGLAGKGKCVEHAQKTAALVNQFKSNKIVTMNLTLFDSTPLAAMARKGEFVEATNAERADELRELLKLLDPPGGTILDTTHPTNNIKLMGQLPDDREKLQKQLEEEA